MNTSRSQLSARKKANTAAGGGGGDTEGNLTPRPLLAAEELAGAVASGDYELLLVQLPRNLTADKLHDEDLTAGNLFLDGVHLEHRTDRVKKEVAAVVVDPYDGESLLSLPISKIITFRERFSLYEVPEVKFCPPYVVAQVEHFRERHPVYGTHSPVLTVAKANRDKLKRKLKTEVEEEEEEGTRSPATPGRKKKKKKIKEEPEN